MLGDKERSHEKGDFKTIIDTQNKRDKRNAPIDKPIIPGADQEDYIQKGKEPNVGGAFSGGITGAQDPDIMNQPSKGMLSYSYKFR